MSMLWTSDEIAFATGGTASARFEISGVTFDSREVGRGDLFVAMPARLMTAISSSGPPLPRAPPERSCRGR
jgi:UDP-N-acetylmuramyl pentapeptide synthase